MAASAPACLGGLPLVFAKETTWSLFWPPCDSEGRNRPVRQPEGAVAASSKSKFPRFHRTTSSLIIRGGRARQARLTRRVLAAPPPPTHARGCRQAHKAGLRACVRACCPVSPPTNPCSPLLSHLPPSLPFTPPSVHAWPYIQSRPPPFFTTPPHTRSPALSLLASLPGPSDPPPPPILGLDHHHTHYTLCTPSQPIPSSDPACII